MDNLDIKSQLANTKWTKASNKQIPIAQVDAIADELVRDYVNPGYRAWYCGVINKYGLDRVQVWRQRAKEANYPGRIFTMYVNQAGGYRRGEK